MLIDYLFCHFKELLEKTTQKKDHRDSFSHYCIPNVRIKDLNVFIDGKSFFDLPVKMKKNSPKNYRHEQ